MESPNIAHVPLNPEGALELGLNPCDYCGMGWALVSNERQEHCSDTCDYFKRHINSMVSNMFKTEGLPTDNVPESCNGGGCPGAYSCPVNVMRGTRACERHRASCHSPTYTIK